MSDIEGKAARVAARERGQRMSFKQIRIFDLGNDPNGIVGQPHRLPFQNPGRRRARPTISFPLI
jgi:hypothetical protein